MTVVLIVSGRGDWSAQRVADQLAERGHGHAWIDPGDFPQRLSMEVELDGSRWLGRLTGPAGPVNLAEVCSVFYRRPGDFAMPEGMSGPELRFARAQARVGLGGVLASLPARWINHPSALADAEYKPRQLAVAASVGLAVPRTLVTNEPAAVRRFVAQVGDVVVKPLAEPIVREAGTHTAVWTRRLTAGETCDLDGVEVTAHLFQQWVPKRFEVRVTTVGRRLFPVAIHAASPQARVDWRSDYDALSYESIDCPAAVAGGIGRFLDAFGLRYGAFDFVITPTGEWVMLECNGAGQWGWLAEECGLPIAEALAGELTGEPDTE